MQSIKWMKIFHNQHTHVVEKCTHGRKNFSSSLHLLINHSFLSHTPSKMDILWCVSCSLPAMAINYPSCKNMTFLSHRHSNQTFSSFFIHSLTWLMSQLDETIKKLFREFLSFQIHTTIVRLWAKKYSTTLLHTIAVHRLYLNAGCDVIQERIFQMAGKFLGKFQWKFSSRIVKICFHGKTPTKQNNTRFIVSGFKREREETFEYRLL